MVSALPQGKHSKPKVNSLRLATALLVGGSGLTARDLRAIVHLRELVDSLKAGSKGALVKLQPCEATPWLDVAQVCADSPLIADYFAILLNKLAGLYPESLPTLTDIQHARRKGLSVAELTQALWESDDSLEALTHQYELPSRLTAACLWLAIKPMLETVSEAFQKHFPIQGQHDYCPVCGGPAWAYHGESAKCSLCECTWQTSSALSIKLFSGVQPRGAKRGIDEKSGRQVYLLDAGLFETSQDPGVLVSVIQTLAQEAPVVIDN